MKTMILILAVALRAGGGVAQTTAPLAPGYAALNNISNQMRLVNGKLDANTEKLNKLQKKHNLETAAGIGNNSAGQTAYIAQRQPLLDEAEALRKQHAALRLKEYNLRELYKIPALTPARKKTNP